MSQQNSFGLVAEEYKKWHKLADELARNEYPSVVADLKNNQKKFDAEDFISERRDFHIRNMLLMLHPEIASSCDGDCENCDEEKDESEPDARQMLLNSTINLN